MCGNQKNTFFTGTLYRYQTSRKKLAIQRSLFFLFRKHVILYLLFSQQNSSWLNIVLSMDGGRKSLETWCSDELHNLLGYTDSALSLYLVNVSSKAKSSDDILKVLNEGGMVVQGSQQFAENLFLKCHRKKQSSTKKVNSTAGNSMKSNADWIKKASEYSLIDDEEQEEENVATQQVLKKSRRKEKRKKSTQSSSTTTSSSKRSSSSSKSRRRRYSSSSSDENENYDEDIRSKYEAKLQERANNRRDRKRIEKSDSEEEEDSVSYNKKSQSNLTEEEKKELERERDLKERDEFAKRLIQKDSSNHEKYKKKLDDEDKLARGETLENGMQIQKLRDMSRSTYLKQREERELTLLERQVQEEEEMFDSNQLTKEEKHRLELSKKILALSRKSDNNDSQPQNVYRLPDEMAPTGRKEQRDSLLKSRYQDSSAEQNLSEQQLWEQAQTAKAASLQIGKGKKQDDDKYDLLLFDEDEQIDFVRQDSNKGYDNRRHKKKKKEKETDSDGEEIVELPLTKFEKIKAGRKKLPVFPYREEFLAAVKEHQVLILVGETGSGKTTQIPQYLHEVGYSELGKIG